MSILKSILKWFVIILISLFIVGFIALKLLSEDRPVEIPNTNADAVTQQMFTAMNKPAWDSLKYLKWEFMRGHRYLWDKQNNHAVILFDDKKVVMDLDQVDGIVYANGKKIEGPEAAKIKETAWSNWCNDSFWMFAPFKAKDKGTKRTIVETDEAKTGLMVSYESGGVTPGDGYLWLLGEDHIPTGYKMWTFVPLQGMKVSWENWKTLKGGAKVALSHKSPLLKFDMKDVAEGDSPEELGFAADIFADLN